ncbi:MAG: hypothetical protein AAGJ87_09020 [Pseudomonadota bacterium]
MKTPMLRPVLEAVTFGFERIGMMIRIAWFPIVLTVALHIALFSLFVDVSAFSDVNIALEEATNDVDINVATEEELEQALEEAFADFDGADIAGLFFASIIASLLSMLIFAPVLVAATRASTLADYEPPSWPIYFAIGSREVKYVVVQILYSILITVIAVVFGGLAIASLAGMAAFLESIDGPIRLLIATGGAVFGAGFVFLGVWLALRFITVLPIAAVENRIDFGAAWRMTAGNFWRVVLSGLFFINILPAATGVLFIAMVAPAVVILLLASSVLSSVAGPMAFALVGLAVLFLVPAVIAVASFSLGAQAAFPARLYAYLSGCGDDF